MGCFKQLLSQSSKRLIQLLFSFSLLCLIQSLNPLLMKFHSYMTEKSYMFLICIGLVAFIAMDSGLIKGRYKRMEYAIDNEKSIWFEYYNNVLESEIATLFEGENVVESTLMMHAEEENAVSDTEEEKEERNALMIIDEDEREREELNKKCEEFIKKMKAAIYYELIADDGGVYFDNQRSLVVVN